MNGTDGINILHRNIPLCCEIIGATKKLLSKSGIDWSEEEAKELFYSILEWWDADKSYLQIYNNSNVINNEFRERFAYITDILTFVIIPRLSIQTDESIKEQLFRLLKELNNYDIPCLSAEAISILVFPEKINDIYNSLENSSLSTDKERISNTYKGIFQLLTLKKIGKPIEIPIALWDFISLPIKWRRIQSLIFAINITDEIMNKIPDVV